MSIDFLRCKCGSYRLATVSAGRFACEDCGTVIENGCCAAAKAEERARVVAAIAAWIRTNFLWMPCQTIADGVERGEWDTERKP